MKRKEFVIKNIIVALACYCSLLSLQSQASDNVRQHNSKPFVIHPNITKFGVELGATRVIYHLDSRGASLVVSNKQNYPVLVQSKVTSKDLKTDGSFVVTPPLFRLNSNQQSRLWVVQTGGNFPADRESLQLLCVKAIPPSGKSAWEQDPKAKLPEIKKANLNINILMNKCIVLFVRPSGLKGDPVDYASHVAWHFQDHHLVGKNDSPYYIALSEVMVNGQSLPEIHYIPPFASYSFNLPKAAKENGKIQWQVISDLGGDSQLFESSVS